MLNLIKRFLNIKNGIILIVLTTFFVFLSNSFKKNKSKDISNFVVPVEKGILSESINTSGEVKATRTSNIGPRKQGIIKELKVKEGDLVKKGQILATLDDEDFIYKLEELELNLKKQKSQYLRREFLYKEGAVSREDYESYKNNYNTSEAKFSDAKAEENFYLIKAPYPGKITAKYAEIGAYVTPSTNLSSDSKNKNFIFELSEGLEIIAKVPESDIGRIKKGQEASVRIEAYPSNKYSAIVKKIAERAVKDNNVTSFEVTLKFKEISEEIKIGMTADLEFKVKSNEEKILVPTVSIVTEKGEKGILKVDKNNYPKFEKIEIGISSGNKTSIIDGLKPGEQIFIDIPPWANKRK
ncbi:possible membrane fusion protein [Prochlorococcus marinus str. MIT 9515]|uniref:Possible membrane fusion protein n=1 Tax=Prochlorococcus marinus (strain MIT 9515) TaxID=167542 RepID=A2BXJ9_PROM5|nr:efflux RND transporter periplasmic adaptor subunit [Prochlorococcus marinus]ABM72510.1 possible membrane fusion protein [Prochlorococcus marinus str. MIT 9515]